MVTDLLTEEDSSYVDILYWNFLNTVVDLIYFKVQVWTTNCTTDWNKQKVNIKKILIQMFALVYSVHTEYFY